MGKVKLPKSLLRVLFPKKKKKKHSDEKRSSSLVAIPEGKSSVQSAVKARFVSTNVQLGGISNELQTPSSTAPTVSPSFSEETNQLSIVSMQFTFDDYDDTSFASDKADTAAETSSEVKEFVATRETVDSEAVSEKKETAEEEEKTAITIISTNATTETNPPPPPSSPVRYTLEPLPNHSSPSAQRARLKALARQQRILSQCEERLNALTGTAEATLSEATKTKAVDKQKLIREKQKAKRLVLEKKSNETQFSTIMFYERNQADEGINHCDQEQLLAPSSTSSLSKTDDSLNKSDKRLSVGSLNVLPPPCTTPISFFILLLDPKSRIFELIEIDNADNSSTVQQVLDLIPIKCTDDRLKDITYIGLCRPSDQVEFINLSANAFASTIETCPINTQCIIEDDVLVAILQNSTGFQMCKISKPILKNDKFREMIRRIRKGKQNSKTHKAVEIIDATQLHEVSKPESAEEKKEKYNALCNKLQSLSKKLHQVDEEIMAGEVTLQSKAPQALLMDTSNDVAYRMSPKMVAFELAQHIEDIFADHDVEILAVDADDDDESDDESFVSARSHRSVTTVRSFRSLMAKQMALARNKQQSRSQRANNRSLFESDANNDLALQIEAMARQAEEAFGGRFGRMPTLETDEKDNFYELPDMPNMVDASDENENMNVIPEEFESSDILDTMKSLTRGSSVVDVSKCTPSQKEAFSRNFLNTSTSMGKMLIHIT